MAAGAPPCRRRGPADAKGVELSATRPQTGSHGPVRSRGASPAGAVLGARTVLGMDTDASTVAWRKAL